MNGAAKNDPADGKPGDSEAIAAEGPDRPDADPEPDAQFPVATTRDSRSSRRYGTHFWWLTLASLVVAVTLVMLSVDKGSLEIAVRFEHGHGIKPGDALRYRDIDVGRVTAVELTTELAGVEVTLLVDEKAASVAREGSRFWIERPRVSLSRVSGLETVVGPKYVVVDPGRPDAAPATSFKGLETPPTIAAPVAIDIMIRFREGHGLGVGDVLKYRGIDIGEVTSVHLATDLSQVTVAVRLVESASRLARAGSQFWVERPRIQLTEVRGIDTLVSGRYLAVLPGPPEGRPLRVFDGLETPPTLTERTEGGLEIILESTEKSGLSRGSPVVYRGIPIGQITALGLSSDATKVEASAYIHPPYRQLVHANSRFWSISGIDVKMGFTGLKLDIHSLSTIAAGGVALATPDQTEKQVATGHRFRLYSEAEDEWREWRPRIALGNTLLPEGSSMPQPMRASLRWKERGYVGFTTARQRDGWVLPLVGGRLLGPLDLLSPIEGAIDDQAVLEVAGQEYVIAADKTRRIGKLALFAVDTAGPELGPRWVSTRVRVPREAENALIVGDPRGVVMPLTMKKATDEENVWKVDASIPLDSSWHGASVVSRQDGFLVGVLLFDAESGEVAALAREALAD